VVEASPGTQRFQNRMDTNQNCHLDFMVARRRAGIGDASGMMRVAQLEVKTHELICQVRRADCVLGFLVIHSLFRGSSRGGIRMASDISEEEVRLLAEGMTLKFGLLGLPQGGAKAGIRSDPDAPAEERYAALQEFGQAVAPLLRSRTYIPGPDMGTSNEMVRRMLVAEGVPVHHRELRGFRSGYFTALSVLSAARHAADAIGLKVAGARVSIEGFGKVGSALALLFHELGARVVAISTSCGALYDARGLDVPSLARACEAKGSRFVVDFDGAERCKREMVFEAPAEILCPCARHNTITAANAGGVQARIVSSGSNHPYDLETERRLTARGTVLLPYWISNCGGTLGETMEFAGWHAGAIAAFLHRRLEPTVRWLIGEARKTGLTQTEIAKPLAFARFQRLSEQSERSGVGARIAGAGLECYRRGLVPSGAVRLLSRSYFERSVLLPLEQETVM
jgi:glutamate dehydrogenase/leucine dehydrogenase